MFQVPCVTHALLLIIVVAFGTVVVLVVVVAIGTVVVLVAVLVPHVGVFTFLKACFTKVLLLLLISIVVVVVIGGGGGGGVSWIIGVGFLGLGLGFVWLVSGCGVGCIC